LGAHFPALVLAQNDATRPGLEELAAELAARGVEVALAGGRADGALVLPTAECPATMAPIPNAVSLYRLLAQVAVARGRNPDAPPFLSKVTATV
jgi:glucosamine--fructose-6-phosphate aminotransferase (isomerizing)